MLSLLSFPISARFSHPDVTSTQSAKDGFFLQRENPADLIIMDIFMPDINGLEAIQRLKKQYPDTPIFAISGGRTMGGKGLSGTGAGKGGRLRLPQALQGRRFHRGHRRGPRLKHSQRLSH